MGITAETRRESNELLDRETLNSRIVSVLKNETEMTAREIAEVMHSKKYIPYPVRQAVQPRLTELEADGIVEVCGKKRDYQTDRNVALYRLVNNG